MDRAAHAQLWPRTPRAAARRRDDSLEAGLEHPIFDPLRPWIDRAGGSFSLDLLNSFSKEQDLKTESGQPVRFVTPGVSDPYYEIHLFETGEVQTRPDNNHDLFNALVWLAFPRTKARINAMHASEIPREKENSGGRRGRLRDMLTIFDEGGAIAVCNEEVAELVRGAQWTELFMEKHRELRIVVLGHAVLEQALAPYPGITCKVVFAGRTSDLDAHCARWLSIHPKSPRDLPPLPIMGTPGWYPGNGTPEFYRDTRYFRVPAPAGR